MAYIKDLLENWSDLLALPKPKILPSRSLEGSFYEKKGRQHIIHVRFTGDQESLAFHELGHFFLEVHMGSIVSESAFKKLFGDIDEPYDSILLKIPGMRLLPPTEDGFPSLYAQAHPEEDWAECFSRVMECIIEDEDSVPDTDDELLDKKYRFIDRAIQKALKKGAA